MLVRVPVERHRHRIPLKILAHPVDHGYDLSGILLRGALVYAEGARDEVVLHVDDEQAAHRVERLAEPRAPRRKQLVQVDLTGVIGV